MIQAKTACTGNATSSPSVVARTAMMAVVEGRGCPIVTVVAARGEGASERANEKVEKGK